MPDAASIRKDAELVVDVCMTVEADDVVTIITDDEHSHEARAVAEVCMERGAWPVVMNNEMQVRRGLADTHFPMAPPQNLHQAMTHSDEIIIITNLEWANRFAHISAVKESVANNAKIASVEPGMGDWGLTVEMLHAARTRAENAMKALEGVEKVRVTSPKGSDFTVTIKGRPPLALVPIKERGIMMGPLPLWAEVAYAAVEDQTEGTMVVDGVVLDATLQVVDDGRYIIKDGQWAL
jgi:leucyl aminopeptidase (aminopeptidase T)